VNNTSTSVDNTSTTVGISSPRLDGIMLQAVSVTKVDFLNNVNQRLLKINFNSYFITLSHLDNWLETLFFTSQIAIEKLLPRRRQSCDFHHPSQCLL
jgi:hypothetical protein